MLRSFRAHDADGLATWMLMQHPELQSELRTLEEQRRYEEAITHEAHRLYSELNITRRESYQRAIDRIEGRIPDEPVWDEEEPDDVHTERQNRGTATDRSDEPDFADEVKRMMSTMLGCNIQSAFDQEAADVRDCYRRLCKLLHPDSAAHLHAGTAALWHQVQEAYAEKDYFRLSELLAHAELASGAFERFDTIGELADFEHRLLFALESVSEEIEEAKKSPAWRFHAWKDSKKKRNSAKLKHDLTVQITILKCCINDAVRQRMRHMHAYTQRRAMPPRDDRQPDFLFDMAGQP